MSIRFAAIAGGSGEVAFWHFSDMPEQPDDVCC
jgi:hypothetical protein